MTKRMLIDASHPEETRVVVLDGNRLEAFDIESANRMPLKGNIYLARVVRVEPSLQAAFVEYGGNRHGFLAFGEIHPDYYQLPVADRQRLIEMQQAEAREEQEREDAEEAARDIDAALNGALEAAAAAELEAEAAEPEAPSEATMAIGIEQVQAEAAPADGAPDVTTADAPAQQAEQPAAAEAAEAAEAAADEAYAATAEAEAAEAAADAAAEEDRGDDDRREDDRREDEYESVGNADAPPPETVGGTTEDDARERRIPPRFLRHYKIQEVIKRRQIMLVQVVKEERGSKGAALTTYISLAGRFSVLMPNSPRGGGVSRKITSAADRKRLREIIDEQGLPQGMSLIVRTAGAARPKPEIKRDCEYLLRLWDGIRERTFASSAPALIYEEADLIKRSIRDVYGKDVEEVLVDGEDAYNDAREFMRMLMPAHASKVRPVRDGVPLFARHGVDAQLDAMHSPTVQLKSGGYIVINQTEALVAIDVNSGRATRDRHIEDTALRTNLEAADEVARQLRLRDLAGLIVIDFIDMESNKHDGMVERRLKEALKQDRARIQVGRISHFGLLEMSRQRLRPSVVEHAYVACPHCQGRGLVRGVESSGLQVLRAIEEEGAKRRAAEIIVHVATPVMLWLLNRKRERLSQIEQKYAMSVLVQPDDTLIPPALRIERTRPQNPDAIAERPSALRMDYAPEPVEPDVDVLEEEVEETPPPRQREQRDQREPRQAREPREPRGEPAEPRAPREGAPEAEGDATAEGQRRRRRRRRRGGRREGMEGRPEAGGDTGLEGSGAEDEGEEGDEPEVNAAAPAEPPAEVEAPGVEAPEAEGEVAPVEATEEEGAARRRRGRRGGRRRREGEEAQGEEAPVAAAPPPRRAPTPADPFAGHMDDIFSAMEAAEEAAARAVTTRRLAAAAPVEAAAEAAPAVAEAPAAEAPAAEAPVAQATEAPAAPAPAAEAPAAEPAATVEASFSATAEASFTPAAPEAAAEPAPPPAPEPAAPEAAAEPAKPAVPEVVAAPPIAPIVLGEGTEADLPRKRGWWRR
ncbi:ribonuclease E/G [Roseomonas stagni]|uniref:Ribonuclease E n=1 Tax=Falsiroseomonas algicola TaxID=2716930 RepID=A0A6M1LMY0_9PROT|nr:ribonuclease E/G [Falsiroseomonas algicola]NGM21422.1 ribonuclease E/G [Falsiroseomonas algicola]